MRARVNFVGGENFVNDAHVQDSLAKQKRVSVREELQLRLDGFGKFFVADQALHFFYDLPVFGD
jgi:hypothetical protein